MGFAGLLESIEDVGPPGAVVRGTQTALFATAGVLLFYFVLDTIGLESGPLDSYTMLLVLFIGLALAAAVFVTLVDIPYSYYLLLIVFITPWIVMAREHLVHGSAGVTSPVTRVFMTLIVAALLLGGGSVDLARRLSSRTHSQPRDG